MLHERHQPTWSSLEAFFFSLEDNDSWSQGAYDIEECEDVSWRLEGGCPGLFVYKMRDAFDVSKSPPHSSLSIALWCCTLRLQATDPCDWVGRSVKLML